MSSMPAPVSAPATETSVHPRRMTHALRSIRTEMMSGFAAAGAFTTLWIGFRLAAQKGRSAETPVRLGIAAAALGVGYVCMKASEKLVYEPYFLHGKKLTEMEDDDE
eukprot:ANDGO_06516.mRNA.1 hypothetical protein